VSVEGTLALLTAGLAGLGIAEHAFYIRKRKRIPLRLHVAGTRGKSSVTRLLAAGLKDAGIPTVAKTTGTMARMIFPDGREFPVFRPSGPNLIEQKRIISTAADLGAKAVVIECMALQPILHWVSENQIIRATHGVITNVRADHLDVMGPSEDDVARALAGMIPVKGKLFTAERKRLPILAEACRDRGTELIALGEDEIAAISYEQLTGFSYFEHAENVALALKVLSTLGIDRNKALRSMQKAVPDPGALSLHRLHFYGRELMFVNAFAANDPESTERIWREARERNGDYSRVVAVFNLRADRPLRTAQLAKQTAFWREAAQVVLMGDGAMLFGRMAASVGADVSRFIYAQGTVEEAFEHIVEASQSGTLIIGMGNTGGSGMDLVRLFRNRADTESP